MRAIPIVAGVLITCALTGCAGTNIAGPSAPIAGATPISSSAPKPTIVSLSPDTGSIYGGGVVTLIGRIDRRATATLGGTAVRLGWNPTDDTRFSFVSPPHTAGPVDIVVTNPGGGSQTRVGAYT